ncbi:adhesion G-protein coupled receptor F1-like isoform X2 [Petromyzon marinus]
MILGDNLTLQDVANKTQSAIVALRNNGTSIDSEIPKILKTGMIKNQSLDSLLVGDWLVLQCSLEEGAPTNGMWNGSDIGEGQQTHLGNEVTLTFNSVKKVIQGDYECSFNLYGVLYYDVITVPPPVLLTAPWGLGPAGGVTLRSGDTKELSCCFAMTDNPEYNYTITWKVADQVLGPSQVFNNTAGPRCINHTVLWEDVEQPRTYSCWLAVDKHNVSSSIDVGFYVTRYGITFNSMNPKPGESVKITYGRNLRSNEIVTWFKDGLELNTNSIIYASVVGAWPNLTIPNVQLVHQGTYLCQVLDGLMVFEGNGMMRITTMPEVDPTKGTPSITSIPCNSGGNVSFVVCLVVPASGSATWTMGNIVKVERINLTTGCSTYLMSKPSSCSDIMVTCTFTMDDNFSTSKTLTLVFTTDADKLCNVNGWPATKIGSVATIPCGEGYTGFIQRNCFLNGTFDSPSDNCVSNALKNASNEIKDLQAGFGKVDVKVPEVLAILTNVTTNKTIYQGDVKSLSETLENIANVSTNHSFSRAVVKNFMDSVSNLLSPAMINSEAVQVVKTESSRLLQSVEAFANTFNTSDTQKDFDITTDNIVLNGTVYSNDSITQYLKEYNSSNVKINKDVITSLTRPITITSIFFKTLGQVLNSTNGTANTPIVGSIVISTILKDKSSPLSSITMEMMLIPQGRNLTNYSCVFWDFKINNNLGGWSNDGCIVSNYSSQTNVLTCTCYHLTSFSVLMSPNGDNAISEGNKNALSIITYVGVGISMGALVCALIIEAVAWRYVRKQENSRMRHIILINICVSLLFADVWFIVAASDASTKYNTNLCLASTFLMHLGYLSVFFWMLCEGLFLFYLVVIIFSRVAMKHLRAAAFAVGYGAPAIIAIVTIAVTKPRDEYTRKGVCWLDWEKSRALLSFVVPALVIVGFNTIILVVVLTKILRRRSVSAAISEGPSVRVKQLAKSIAVMMPVLGVTWGLGIFAFSDAGSNSLALHYLFTIFNSLQGLFIFLFDCLMDIEVRKAIKKVTGIDLVTRHEGSSSQGPHGKSRSTGMTDPRLKTKVKGTVRDRVRQSGPTLPSLSTSNYDSLVSE